MKTLNGTIFLETKDIKDFPAKKIGKSWLVMEQSFKDYFQNNEITND